MSGNSSGPHLADPLDDVAKRLSEQAEALADGIADQIFATIPSYEAVNRPSLLRSLRQHIETAATSLMLGEVPRHVQDVSVAAERARSGIPIEHVLLAIRLAFQRLREFVTSSATELGVTSDLQLDAVRILWEVNDLVSREYAVAHRDEDLEMARTAETQRIEFLRRLLAEGAGTPDMNMRAGSCGLAAGARYRAFRGRPHDGGSASSVLQEILRWARGHGLEPLGAVVDGDAVGVLADGEFLPDGPTVGIGPPAELHRVNESFLIAGQLMEVGAEFGRRGPQTVESISLALAVATEHTVGDVLVERILRPLLDQGSYGQELIASLDAFLSADMNTARAASLLVVHPNTLRYRMNQVKALSGLELHSPRAISEVWWALRRYEWTTKTGYSS